MLHPPVTRSSSGLPKHVAFSPLKGPALPEEQDAEVTRAYITARAEASSCASEDPSFHDAPSEVGSFVSAASSFDASSFSEGGSPLDLTTSRCTEAEDAARGRDDGGAQHRDVEGEEEACGQEQEAWMSESAAAASELAALRRRVEELQREVDRLSSVRSDKLVAQSGQAEAADSAAAARLVAGAFARVVATEDAAAAWKGEVQRLRQRVERSALMENIAQQQRQQQQQAQDVVARRALRLGFAVGCLGLGAMAAFLVVRSSRK